MRRRCYPSGLRSRADTAARGLDNRGFMHLLVPFASDTSEACRHVLRDLALPNLARLLASLSPTGRDAGAPASFSPPHERALAAAWGWRGRDGALPFAARAAAADGAAVGDRCWALVTPAHWQLGRDHVLMTDPSQLALAEAQSRELFDAVRGLFESEGFAAAFGDASRWYIARDDLDGFATASLDRAIGRSVDGWLGQDRSAIGKLVRRLQSEAQLVFHVHAVNEAREEREALVVNSFWLSGCGRAQPADPAATPEIATSLRTPLLAGDWAAWAEAWQALDAGAIAGLVVAAERGDKVTLTLCGELTAARFERQPRPLWQRLAAHWRGVEPHAVLEAL